MIYHITHRSMWEYALQEGQYRAESLAKQGFIHFSQVGQVARVANTIYSGETDLVLLVVDADKLTAPLRYEPPDHPSESAHQGDEQFPHLYGPLNISAVQAVIDFTADAQGVFHFPDPC